MVNVFIVRDAEAVDIARMGALIFEHGKNEWNYLPDKGVRDHLGKIASGDVRGVIAESSKEIVGFVTFHPTIEFVRFRTNDAPHGYIAEAVVHGGYAGQGLGARLLHKAVEHLNAEGFDEIYIERHEENRASAAMMKKAGFVEVESYPDPVRRSSGTRRTTVSRIRCQ